MSDKTILSLDLSESGNELASPNYTGLCVTLPTMVMKLLREYYKDGPYLNPMLGHLRYFGSDHPSQRSEVQKHLEIEIVDTFRGDQLGQNPKLLIREDAVSILSMGLADSLRMGAAAMKGSRQSERQWVGSMVVFCASQSRGESRLLAVETAQLLSHYLNEIRRHYVDTLKRIRCTQIMPTGKIAEMPNFFGTGVVIDYAYVENVKVWQNRLPIREIVMKITSQ